MTDYKDDDIKVYHTEDTDKKGGATGWIIGGLALLSREGLMRQRGRLQAITPYARPIAGVMLLGLGLFLWFQLNHVVEGWLLDTLPTWLIDASVAL